jgi:hypothetical protein
MAKGSAGPGIPKRILKPVLISSHKFDFITTNKMMNPDKIDPKVTHFDHGNGCTSTFTDYTPVKPGAGTGCSNGTKAPSNEPAELSLDIQDRATKLFGNAEVVTFDDERIPADFADSVMKLKITGPNNNILAASCGNGSNLCTIAASWDNPTLMNQILEMNPILYSTVWTHWRRIAIVWIRVESWRPANRALLGVLWSSDGILPVSDVDADRHCPLGFPDRDKGCEILTIKFDDLKWPPHIRETFLMERIVGQYGPLIQQIVSKKPVINYLMAAAYFGAVLRLAYDTNNDRFLMLPSGKETVEPLSMVELNTSISIWLQRQAAKYPTSFPVGNHVQHVVKVIKEICTFERTDELAGLNQYLHERLERRAGSNHTTNEIFANYSEYCKVTGLAMFPECVFLQRLPKTIREQFGLTKVHNVMRHHDGLGRTTARYGYNGLGIKPDGSAEAKEVGEAEEHPEGGKKKAN